MDEKTVHDRRWAILGVLILSLLMVVLDNSVLNVALKTLADPKPRGLEASQSALEWAINSYTLVFAGMLLTWGVLGDRYGRRRVLLIGFVLFGLASIASAYAHTPNQLIAARGLMGLGGAAVMPATLAIITNVFDPKERPKAIGIWAGAVGLAIAIGPIVGGALLVHFWWGSVFLINVPIVTAAAVLSWLLVPESRNPRPGRLDIIGVVLAVLGLVLVVYSIIKIGDLGSVTTPQVWSRFLGGVLVLGIFVIYERGLDDPVLDLNLFKDRRFSAAVGAVGLTFFALMGTTFFMVFYMQAVRGKSPLQAGVLLLPLAIGQLMAAPRSPVFVRRFGARAVCSTGLALVAVTFLGYVILGLHSSLWILEIIFFLQGVGMGNVMPPATESIMSSLPREKAGAGSAVNNVARQVGAALGVAVIGSVLAAVYRKGLGPIMATVQLPKPTRDQIEKSVEATHTIVPKIAEHVDIPGPQILQQADVSFVHAMHVAAYASGGVALMGALVSLFFLPGRRPPEPGPIVRTEEPIGAGEATA